MADALSDRTIDIVKATIPALEKGGTAVTDRMYQILFTNPEIRDLFNQSHHGETGSQSKALTAAVIAYGRNIDNLGVLASRVERITQKHVALNILPEHYHFVAEALLGAIKDVLGDAATDEVLEAWGEAYWFLADLLMARESNIYARLAAAQGGWNGWRDFAVENTKLGERGHPLLHPGSDRRPRGHAPPPRPVSHLRAGCAGCRAPQAQLLDLLRSRRPLLSHQRQARGEAGCASRTGLELAARSCRPRHGAQGGATGRRVLP